MGFHAPVLLCKFCRKYQPKPKPEKRNHWGSKLLAKIRVKGKAKKISPGQKSLWEEGDTPLEEIRRVAEQFVLANCFDPKIASRQFDKSLEPTTETEDDKPPDPSTEREDVRCQVTDPQNADSS